MGSIAHGFAVMAHRRENWFRDFYMPSKGCGIDCGREDSVNVNLSVAPSELQAIFSEETEETRGEVKLQNIGAKFTFVEPESNFLGKFQCGDLGVIFSAIGALSIIPGFEFLGGLANPVPGLGLSVACDLQGHGF